MNPIGVTPLSIASTQKVAWRVKRSEWNGAAQNLYMVSDQADSRRSALRSLWHRYLAAAYGSIFRPARSSPCAIRSASASSLISRPISSRPRRANVG